MGRHQHRSRALDMADVTSGLLNVNTAGMFQLTAERFPVGESPRHDNEDDDFTKTGISSSSSEAEDRRLASSDFSLTTRRNCSNEQRPLVDVASWWNDAPPSRPRNDDDDIGLERLAADSAVGRLALMIQRFAANSQRDLPVSPPSSRLHATPHLPLMTSSGDVTWPGDRTRYHCHVCSYVGKSLCVDIHHHHRNHRRRRHHLFAQKRANF